MVTMQDNSEYIRVEDLQLMVDEISEEVVNKEKVILFQSYVFSEF